MDKSPAQDQAFVRLLDAYRPHGGISRMQNLPSGLHTRSGGHVSDIEELVSNRKLCGFRWQRDLWIPLFQFDLNAHAIAPAPQQVISEMDRGFDGWEMANWFVQPSAWLDDHSPIDWLGSHRLRVLEAARADRFVATG